MEPITTTIVTALALGAATGLQETVSQAVKDAYSGLKGLIQAKFEKVNLDLLEGAPDSKNRQQVVAEDLETSGAVRDAEVLRLAKALLDTVQASAPEVARTIGVDLKDIRVKSLAISSILAEGAAATGVRGKNWDVAEDIKIEGVTVRSHGDSPEKKELTAEDVRNAVAPAVSLQNARAGRDIIIGLSPERAKQMMLEVLREEGKAQGQVEALSRELSVTREAVVGFFRILDAHKVPVEKLPETLAEIAGRHKEMLGRLSALDADAPEIKEQIEAARAAVETSDYDLADWLLSEAEAAELDAVRQADDLAQQAQTAGASAASGPRPPELNVASSA